MTAAAEAARKEPTGASYSVLRCVASEVLAKPRTRIWVSWRFFKNRNSPTRKAALRNRKVPSLFQTQRVDIRGERIIVVAKRAKLARERERERESRHTHTVASLWPLHVVSAFE